MENTFNKVLTKDLWKTFQQPLCNVENDCAPYVFLVICKALKKRKEKINVNYIINLKTFLHIGV